MVVDKVVESENLSLSSVLTVEKMIQFHSSQEAIDQFYVGIVSDSKEKTNNWFSKNC